MEEPVYVDEGENPSDEPQYVDVDDTGTPVFPKIEAAGEFAGVAFTSLRKSVTKDGQLMVIEVNITGRGRNAREAFENLEDGVKYAHSKGYSAWQTRGQARPVPQEVPAVSTTSLPSPVGNIIATTTPTTVPPAQPQPTEQSINSGTLIVNRLETKPRADGRVDLDFFSQGLQYRVIGQTATPERAIELLKPLGNWTLEHLKTAASYNISASIQWVNSEKVNSKGNPYKNIVGIFKA